VVEPVLRQRVQVAEVIEVQVQDRAVVLARCDEHGRLPAEEEVPRVLGVQGERRVGGGDEQQERQHLGLRSWATVRFAEWAASSSPALSTGDSLHE
jgi:hypothetical protein